MGVKLLLHNTDILFLKGADIRYGGVRSCVSCLRMRWATSAAMSATAAAIARSTPAALTASSADGVQFDIAGVRCGLAARIVAL